MVNMIGFHHREPEYNTAGPGEDGYYCRVAPIPTPDFPHRARVSTPTGHGIFHDFDDAQQFMDTPHRDMAEAYMEWLHGRSTREDLMNLDDLKNLPTPPSAGFQANITQPLLAKVKSGEIA